MHKISERNTHLAVIHALTFVKYGKAVERFGEALQRSSSTQEEFGQLMEKYGKLIQHYAQESLLYATLLEKWTGELYSVDFYTQAVQGHVQATQAFLQASQMYQQSLKAYLNYMHSIGNMELPANTSLTRCVRGVSFTFWSTKWLTSAICFEPDSERTGLGGIIKKVSLGQGNL